MKNQVIMAVMVATVGLTAVSKPTFFLPERVYAAPGLECNIYYSNIFDTAVPHKYVYQSYCTRGRSEVRRWCYTPKAEDAGKEFRLIINAWDDEGVVAAVTTTVQVASAPVPEQAGRRITLSLLADSLVNCYYQDWIEKDMRAGGFPSFTMVGSHQNGPGGAMHDGYGGFAFDTFFDRYVFSEDEVEHAQDESERAQMRALGVPEKIIYSWQRELLRSPFLRLENGKKVIDLPRWLGKINGGKAPDVVVVELGGNSVHGLDAHGQTAEPPKYRTEEELRLHMREHVIPRLEHFVARLRQDMPDALYVVPTVPHGCSQDGFAENYGSTWSEAYHRKINFALNREFDRYLKQRNDPKLVFVAWGHAVDPEDGFIRQEQPVSARSEKKILRDANAFHPSHIGGAQLGDAFAAYLRCYYGAN